MSTRSSRVAVGFASALSTERDGRRAVDEVCRAAAGQLPGNADLGFVFLSADYGPDFEPLLAEIRERTGVRHLLGCTGESIVGRRREVEEQPALSLWLAALPGATLVPMHLQFEQTAEGGTFVGWPDALAPAWPANAALFVLAEPYTFATDVMLARLGDDQPGIPIMGGVASGGHGPGDNRVFLDERSYDSGAVAVLLHGGARIRSVVSQGCRPIGRRFVITKAERQVITELGGKPALAQLHEVYAELSPEEQQLVQQGLHLGRVLNEQQEDFGRGDFLVRNCLGADRATGAIAIGDYVRTGQTVQFHVRDAASADEDLHALLTAARDEAGPPAAALLFTCNGRGTRLFDLPDHDARAVDAAWGDIPVAGFFAQGEIGPIGGRNFVHGFTASLAMFLPEAESKTKETR